MFITPVTCIARSSFIAARANLSQVFVQIHRLFLLSHASTPGSLARRSPSSDAQGSRDL